METLIFFFKLKIILQTKVELSVYAIEVHVNFIMKYVTFFENVHLLNWIARKFFLYVYIITTFTKVYKTILLIPTWPSLANQSLFQILQSFLTAQDPTFDVKPASSLILAPEHHTLVFTRVTRTARSPVEPSHQGMVAVPAPQTPIFRIETK